MDETENEICWMALSMVPGLGVKRSAALFDRYRSAEQILNALQDPAMPLKSQVGPKVLEAMQYRLPYEKARRVHEDCVQKGIAVITQESSLYPELLRHVDDRPMLLYASGRLQLLQTEMFSIVGARKCSPYGRRAALALGECVVRKGYTLVSGLALGIDAYGHEGALTAEGGTIAVMGCGPDVCYPPENAALWRRIRKQGLIISEYPPGTQARSEYFPQRNRIISGLSQGVILVEAAEQSGSLITADRALNQGRDLYLVPGSVYSAFSKATNRLISEGAGCMLRSGADIPPAAGLQKKPSVSPVFTSAQDERVFSLIQEEGRSTKQLINESGSSLELLYQSLTSLEMQGLIQQTDDYKWVRKDSI